MSAIHCIQPSTLCEPAIVEWHESFRLISSSNAGIAFEVARLSCLSSWVRSNRCIYDSHILPSAHEQKKPYECAYCRNCFKNKNEAGRHQKSVHLRHHSWSCAAFSGYAAVFYTSPSRPNDADSCGYCGEEFLRTGIWLLTRGRRTGGGSERAGLGSSDCVPAEDSQVWGVPPHEEVGGPFPAASKAQSRRHERQLDKRTGELLHEERDVAGACPCGKHG
jgi:hypothetical protein